MNLEQKIMAELKTAMLAKDEAALRSLRAVKAAILLPIYPATTIESLMAAASPTMIAINENNPTIRPRRKPLITARITRIIKTISMITGCN